MLYAVGTLCILFGLVDFAGMFFGYDLTGVRWSPVVAGVIGGWLIKLANKMEEREAGVKSPEDSERSPEVQ